jgi:hypothetical protein
MGIRSSRANVSPVRIVDLPGLSIALSDPLGNVGGFIVRDGGGLKTPAIDISDTGEIRTELFEQVRDGDGSVRFVDPVGNVGLLLTPTGDFRTTTGATSEEADVSPIIGDHLHLVEGRALPFYPGNVLSERYNDPPAVMAIASGQLNIEGTGQLMLDPTGCEATGTLTVRSLQNNSGVKKVLPLTMHVAPAGSGATVTTQIIGDSTVKGNASLGTGMAMLVYEEIEAAGYTPQLVGTIVNTGDDTNWKHEGRASRDFDDYVGARITNMVPITGTGGNDDAAYIAGDAAYKAAHNPFLVPVSGGDDILGTGWLFDYGAYRTRFSIPLPQSVDICLVTNSLIGVDLATGLASILRGMDIMYGSIRDDVGPDTVITFYVTTIPRDPESDQRHADRRAPTLRAMIERIRSYSDDNCRLANVHAQMSQEAGWALGDETVDPETGVITSTPSASLDNIHPLIDGARQVARVLSAVAICATLGV